MVFLHKSLQTDVAQHAAFSTQRFSEQKARRALNRQRRRMELHEFHVGQDRAGLVRDSHAIASSDFRIGRLTIDLSQAACRQEHRPGMQLVQREVGLVDEAQAGDAAAVHKQLGSKRMGT